MKQSVTTVSKIYKLFQLKFSEQKTYGVQHAHTKMQSFAIRYILDHQIVGSSKIRENKNRRNVVFLNNEANYCTYAYGRVLFGRFLWIMMKVVRMMRWVIIAEFMLIKIKDFIEENLRIRS